MKGTTLATVLMTATASLGFIQSLTPFQNTALSLLLLDHGMTAVYALPQGPWSDRARLAARKSLHDDDDTESTTPHSGPMYGPPGGMNGTGPGRPHHCHRPPHGNMTRPGHHQPHHGPHGGGNGTQPNGPPHHKCHHPSGPPMPMPHHGGPPKDNIDTTSSNADWDDCWCEPEPAGPPGVGNSTATYTVPSATATLPDPGVTPDPSITADPTATNDPSGTADPSITADPSATIDPSVSDDPTATITSEPSITADSSATATAMAQ